MADLREMVANLQEKVDTVLTIAGRSTGISNVQGFPYEILGPPTNPSHPRFQRDTFRRLQTTQHDSPRRGEYSYSSVGHIPTLPVRKTSTRNGGAVTLMKVYSH